MVAMVRSKVRTGYECTSMLFGLLIQSTVAFRRGHATIKNSKYPMEKKEFFSLPISFQRAAPLAYRA